MKKFTQIKKINETSVMPDPKLNLVFKDGKVSPFGSEQPKDMFSYEPKSGAKSSLIPAIPETNPGWMNNKSDIETPIDGAITPTVTKSEPTKFISKLFESRQMMNVFHLQATGAGAYAEHIALDTYYNGVLELIDELVETYQGQYEILTDYETIEAQPAERNSISYMIELANFIKSTRKLAFLEEDTHLHNIIDEIVALIYRTLYKLKNLK